MFTTKVIEARNVEGRIEEIELGWCLLPEVPVEKRPPVQRPGEPPVQPLLIKIAGEAFWIIGHTWDIVLTPSTENGPKADSQSTLILVVQKVPAMPSGLVRADAGALDHLDRLGARPGGAH